MPQTDWKPGPPPLDAKTRLRNIAAEAEQISRSVMAGEASLELEVGSLCLLVERLANAIADTMPDPPETETNAT